MTHAVLTQLPLCNHVDESRHKKGQVLETHGAIDRCPLQSSEQHPVRCKDT